MERHGRGTGNPWSLRQTGIYQQSYHHAKLSVWVLLQPSKILRTRLLIVLGNKSVQNSPIVEESPMLFHSLVLSLTASNWKSYLDDLDSEVKELVSKA